MSERPDWDIYFLEICNLVSQRSTCLRRKVGAVLVKDNRILATGYNGAPSGLEHCDKVGCLREKLNVPSGERHELCRGLHAEMNAILQAAKYGISIVNSTLYTNTQPCIICAKMIINVGIEKVIFTSEYPENEGIKLLQEAGIEVIKFSAMGK